jgi:short-subunit dehydrogenase
MPTVLSDKTSILTGTSSGIGIVIAYELAKRNPKIINVNNSKMNR